MKRQLRLAVPALALVGALGTDCARAEDGMNWKFSGFGTVGAVTTRTGEAQFRSSPRQSHGAGRSPDLGVDSRLGLQGQVDLDDTFSAVGQLLTSRRDGHETPQVEWLFAQAGVTSWLDVRAGRMVLPVFMISDSRNVGYGAHWARAPGEVYGLYAASSFDGVQAQVRTDWAGTHFVLQASTGKSKADLFLFGGELTVDFKTLHSLNLVVERGDWTLRVGDTVAPDSELKNSPVPVPPVTDRFSGVGLAYDNGKLLLQAEYVARRQGGSGPFDSNSYYATAGYRLGAWMPYATFSRYEPRGSLLTGQPRTRTLAAGVRWDAFHNVALKAQVESAQYNSFNFVNESAAFAASASKANVLTLLADFVF